MHRLSIGINDRWKVRVTVTEEYVTAGVANVLTRAVKWQHAVLALDSQQRFHYFTDILTSPIL